MHTLSLDTTLLPDNLLHPVFPSIYYKRKRKWEELSNLSEIPTWDELQHEIQHLESQLTDSPFLIQLRQQRYTLLEACRPTHYPQYANRHVQLPSHRDTSLSLWETADESCVDKVLLHYADLKALLLDLGPYSPLEEFLRKFNECVRQTVLSPLHRQLVELRMEGLTITEIKEKLQLSYSNNYISTLYQQTIIPKLRETFKALTKGEHKACHETLP